MRVVVATVFAVAAIAQGVVSQSAETANTKWTLDAKHTAETASAAATCVRDLLVTMGPTAPNGYCGGVSFSATAAPETTGYAVSMALTGQTAADCHFALQDTSFFAAASDCLVIKTTPAAATPEEAFESFESGEEGSGEVDDGSDEVLSAVPKTTAPEFTGTQESPTLATAKTEDIVDAEEVDY